MTDDARLHTIPADPTASGSEPRDAAQMLAALAALSSVPVSSATAQIRAYLALVCRLLGVRTAFVARITPDTLAIVEIAHQEGCAIPPDSTHRLEDIFCQYVRMTGTPVVIPDARQDVRVWEIPSRERFTIGSYLGVPVLLGQGTLYGTLCGLDPEPRPFTPAQVDVMRVIAAQIAPWLDPTTLPPTAVVHTPPPAPRAAVDDRTFFGIVTHDLRSPLMSVLGYSDLLIREFGGPLTDDQRDMLDRIQHAARFMSRLVNDLYDVAVLETGALMLVTEAFDPVHLATELLAEYRSVAETTHIALSLTRSTVPPIIVGDRDRLRQILHNFLGNAFRYTQVGSIHLHLEGQPDTITIQVRDTGPGIPADALDQIWERGQRLRSEGHGLGVGLYIVRQLATAMGGTVGVESTLGAGSTFWIQLPIHGPPPQKISGTW